MDWESNNVYNFFWEGGGGVGRGPEGAGQHRIWARSTCAPRLPQAQKPGPHTSPLLSPPGFRSGFLSAVEALAETKGYSARR